jgi:DNA-binding NarL/FixJ family response regulator
MSAGRESRRVVLAEDEVLLRAGIAELLEKAGYSVIGQVGDADELLRIARDEQPDIVIADICMPPNQLTEGLDAARLIRDELPQIGILLLSAHVEVSEAMELLAGGRGIGYLLKDRVSRVSDFIQAVGQVLDGGSVVDAVLVAELLEARQNDDKLRVLTPRELGVLALMAEGSSNAGIARQLFVTEGTVEKHVRSILSKLHLRETPDDHRRVLAVLTFLESR